MRPGNPVFLLISSPHSPHLLRSAHPFSLNDQQHRKLWPTGYPWAGSSSYQNPAMQRNSLNIVRLSTQVRRTEVPSKLGRSNFWRSSWWMERKVVSSFLRVSNLRCEAVGLGCSWGSMFLRFWETMVPSIVELVISTIMKVEIRNTGRCTILDSKKLQFVACLCRHKRNWIGVVRDTVEHCKSHGQIIVNSEWLTLISAQDFDAEVLVLYNS